VLNAGCSIDHNRKNSSKRRETNKKPVKQDIITHGD
jgi:hypothetical protein